jgi:hypothetical protein
MAPDISVANQRPALFIFEDVVLTDTDRPAQEAARSDAA